MRSALRDRLEVEDRILAQHFPGFRIQGRGSDLPLGVVGTMKTQSGRGYGLWMPLRAFPHQQPPLYVVSPRLEGRDGTALSKLGASLAMHMLNPDEHGHPQICHHNPSVWHSRLTVYHVLFKGRLWLEAYEGHLRTGEPIDRWLRHM